MYVAIETVHRPQFLRNPRYPFHGIIGVPYHARTQEKALYIITPIKLHGYPDKLGDRECSPRDIVAPSVDTICAIVLTIIRKHHLQQRYASPVSRKAVTYTDASYGIAYTFAIVTPDSAARRTRDVIFGGSSEYLQFFESSLSHDYFLLMWDMQIYDTTWVTFHPTKVKFSLKDIGVVIIMTTFAHSLTAKSINNATCRQTIILESLQERIP